MKKRRLVLDRQHLMQMLSNRDFYEAVPKMAYLADAALQSWQMYLDDRECRRCSEGWKYMKGVVDAFFIKLREFKQSDPESIEQIKAFLATKKGYRPDPVVLYYRRSRKQGKIAKLVL